MTSVITNSNLDTKAAAVAAPYGPLTRVGEAPQLSPNSHVQVEFTSALGVTVYVSYDDFVDGNATRILEDAHAGRGQNVSTFQRLLHMSEFAYRWLAAKEADSNMPPFSDSDMKTAFQLFGYNPDLVGLSPNYSDRPADRIELAFTLADAGSNVLAVTNTTTGSYDYIMWDFGNGTYKFTSSGSPSNTNMGSTGSKTVTATAVGRGGIVRLSKSVTLA